MTPPRAAHRSVHWKGAALVAAAAVLSACRGAVTPEVASASPAAPLVTEHIDDAVRITLAGNTRPEARPENDRGPLASGYRLDHMLLLLRRSPGQEASLEALIAEQQRPSSPLAHRWLTAEELGARFGPAEGDLAAVTRWLAGHGFEVGALYPGRTMISFSGTAGQVAAAFHTELHALDVNGQRHLANMSDPQIPAALAQVVAGVVSLHDFQPRTMFRRRSNYTFTADGGTVTQAVVPGDLATIYDLNRVFASGNSGVGQTIVVAEASDLYETSDWSTFRGTFGLSAFTGGALAQVHPAPPSGVNNCTDPGTTGSDGEATLDAEWASAAAPGATIEVASCQSTTTFGGLLAIQNLVNGVNPPAIISLSYGECEVHHGATANAAFGAVYQQAAAEGVSVFVSSGDDAAASCDDPDTDTTHATHGVGVSGYASTPWNVAVGGTDFGDLVAGTTSTYWNNANDSISASAISYVPEIPWNDSCGSVLSSLWYGITPTYGATGLCNNPLSTTDRLLDFTGSGGGPSGCASGAASTSGVVSGTCAGWSKPSWQSGLGIPHDTVRNLPDVSLFAADGIWSHFYVYCFSDPAHDGVPCTGAPSGWAGGGGTSFSAPIMAGLQALVNAEWGAQGDPASVYYAMAAFDYEVDGGSACNSSLGNGVSSSCIFHDITEGDTDVPCSGPYNCYQPAGMYGVLSTSDTSDSPMFGATPGWDFATGLGTVDAWNLVSQWPGTSVVLGASATTVQAGAPVELSASVVTGRAAPPLNGTFTFLDGTVMLGAMAATPATDALGHAGGQATLGLPRLSVGPHVILARYDADTFYFPSASSPLTITVDPGASGPDAGPFEDGGRAVDAGDAGGSGVGAGDEADDGGHRVPDLQPGCSCGAAGDPLCAGALIAVALRFAWASRRGGAVRRGEAWSTSPSLPRVPLISLIVPGKREGLRSGRASPVRPK